MSEDGIYYDLAYTQVGDDSAWHLMEKTFVSEGGNFNMVKTRCGIETQWNGTTVDRLPGGDEKSCENCLVLLAGDVDEPKKKKATATK